MVDSRLRGNDVGGCGNDVDRGGMTWEGAGMTGCGNDGGSDVVSGGVTGVGAGVTPRERTPVLLRMAWVGV